MEDKHSQKSADHAIKKENKINYQESNNLDEIDTNID
jgi:hypothetical protein